MIRAVVRLANLGLLTASFLAITPAHADTLLVGTSLANPVPGPELCPLASDCTNRLSQFSTPTTFQIDDVKVAISAPGLTDASTNGSFQVSLITDPGSSQTLIANVGSGSLVFNPSDPAGTVNQIFDFNNLSILINPGIEYYLEVTGGNLSWDRSSPELAGLGTLGQQLECDPIETCPDGITRYNTVPFTYAEQISGDPVPEPSPWVLMGTGLVALLGLGSFRTKSKPALLITRTTGM